MGLLSCEANPQSKASPKNKLCESHGLFRRLLADQKKEVASAIYHVNDLGKALPTLGRVALLDLLFTLKVCLYKRTTQEQSICLFVATANKLEITQVAHVQPQAPVPA